MHRRREDIVGRLPEVDVVVGVHATRRSEPPAKGERCEVGDHLVDVHVALGAGTRLPDAQRELGIELAGRDARRSRGHGLGLGGVEQAELAIDLRRGAFDLGQRVHNLDRHALSSNREEMAAALGLRPPQGVTRDLDRPETVGFDTAQGHEDYLLTQPFFWIFSRADKLILPAPDVPGRRFHH